MNSPRPNIPTPFDRRNTTCTLLTLQSNAPDDRGGVTGFSIRSVQRSAVWSLLVFGIALVISVATASAEEVPLDKVPKPVMDAIKAKFPGCEVTKAGTEVKKGKPINEVYFTFKGASMEVMARPDGFIFVIETVITAKDLPAVVAKAVEAKYPEATFRKVEEVRKVEEDSKKESLHHYTLVLFPKGESKSIVLKFDATGQELPKDA